jgi:hypothetical protein
LKSRLLYDTHSLLADSVQRVGLAQRYLSSIAKDGLPGTTPGHGSIGGGGAQQGWVVEGEFVPATTVEACAERPDLPTYQLGRLEYLTARLAERASSYMLLVTLQRPTDPYPGPMQRTVHAYRCAHLICEGPWDVPTLPELRDWNRDAESLRNLCRTWAIRPDRPTTPQPDKSQLATDLTEMWCTSCLRVGVRTPRHRRELCRWCEQFNASEGFVPPVELCNARANGHRITEAMVAPHRKAHRDALKKVRGVA